ncbi:MAG TPA: L,D-transpeptidase/peptidoglycan binding protein [Solirubrobacterales bacterium]|nr:L,D-transpeptidase/peptidoglycan binding protein [Solirubrobacterales bacterium]
MGRRVSIVLALIVGLFAIFAVGAYAWDQSRNDEIAEGVTIGGVDVSGMTEDEARAEVDEALVEPLRDHVVVRYDGVKYQLSPEKLQVSSDVDGMVDQALDESQEGGLPTRVWRYATGGEVDVAISPQVTYSENAIDEFIAKGAAEVNRDPVDATIEPSAAELTAVQGQNGLAVDEDQLRSRLESAVQSPNEKERTVALPVDEIEPEVTKEELAAQYPTYLTVNRSTFELTLWKELEPVKTYTVAIGAQGFDTPAGVYNIQNKAVDPAWNVPNSDWAGDLAGTVVPGGVPENPLKERWLGIYDGAGIHGTDDVGSLGTAASHGCVRMSVPDVIELYDQVPVGTPIYIG